MLGLHLKLAEFNVCVKYRLGMKVIPFEGQCSACPSVTDTEGLDVAESGILICKDFNGRPSGEAYVQLSNNVDAEKALEKNNANMGHRWGHTRYLTLQGGTGG